MGTRIIVGICAAALLVAAILLGRWVLSAVVIAATLISIYEISQAFQKKEIRLITPVLYGYALFSLPVYYWAGMSGLLALALLAAIITMSLVVCSPRFQVPNLFSTLGAMVYPLMPLTIILMLAMLMPDSVRQMVIVLACACTYLSDTFALFIGMLLGKKKLCERLSPKKTFAGFYGGIVGSILGGVIMLLLTPVLWNITIGWYHYLIVALLCSLLGVAGDLFASSIKRYVGIKDFGTIFPGHGGMLDRIDSLLFTLPVVFVYFELFLL